MSVATNIRAYSMCKVYGGADATIVGVEHTTEGCVVAYMDDGSVVVLGTASLPQSGTVNNGSAEDGVDRDDMRAFSMLYAVANNGKDVGVVGIALTANGDMSITLDNGDVVVAGGVIKVGGALHEDMETPPATSPIYCNSFASILKIIGNIDTTEIEEDISNLKGLVADVEGYVAGYDEKISKLESNDLVIEGRLKSVEQATGSADITELKLQLNINTEDIRELKMDRVPTIASRLSLVSSDVESLSVRVTNIEQTARVVVVKPSIN